MWKIYIIMMMVFTRFIKHVRIQHLTNFISMMVICLKKKILSVPNYFLHEMLTCEAHVNGLMRHFGVDKTLDILHK